MDLPGRGADSARMESPAELTPGEQQDYDQPFC